MAVDSPKSAAVKPGCKSVRTEDYDSVKAIAPLKIDEKTKLIAGAALSSALGAARIVSMAEQPSDRATLWGLMASQLVESSKRVNGGDLTEVEAMLVHQAVALQSIFVKLTEGALVAESLSNYDLKFRYALRAQAQCRMTLETLANIKNPPMVFARQANVTTGPQQINNGTAAPRASELRSGQIELSGGVRDLRQDSGAPALAGPTDTPMAPVGAIDGADVRGWQGTGGAQRVQGRPAPEAPKPLAHSAGPGGAPRRYRVKSCAGQSRNSATRQSMKSDRPRDRLTINLRPTNQET